MWPFKKDKFKNLKREDVVNAICELEKQENDIEKSIEDMVKQIDALMEKGRKEKTQDLKLFYVKKISHLQEEKAEAINRAVYLLYNTRLLNKLKTAIDDNTFYANTGKISLTNLLSDQKGLAKFLNKALNTKVMAEDVLTSADDTFNEVKGLYTENDRIYGVNSSDDDLLAILEAGVEEEDISVVEDIDVTPNTEVSTEE
ncbi:MAG: hypothetical protein IJ008_04685 [Clostridia bacterium]|nr:hypothetical protein [Clostridia bacterium]